MKKASTFILLLSAATLASCTVNSNKTDTSSSSADEVALPSGNSTNAVLAKAKLAATLAAMSDTKTVGVNLKGDLAVKTSSYQISDSSSTLVFDQVYDAKNLVLDAAAKDLGETTCAISAAFTADIKYTIRHESISSEEPITYDGPVAGKAYYESGMLYADGTALMGAVNPGISSEALAQCKVKLPCQIPAFNWSMVMQGLEYIEDYGFAASALLGENGVIYYVYEMSAEQIIRKAMLDSSTTLEGTPTFNGGVKLWIAFDSTQILNVGMTSDMKFDYVLKAVADPSSSETNLVVPDQSVKGELNANLKGVLTYSKVNVEKVTEPDSYKLLGGSSDTSSAPLTD